MQQFDYPAVIAAMWNALGYLAWGWSLPVDRRPAATKAPAPPKTPTDHRRDNESPGSAQRSRSPSIPDRRADVYVA